MNTREGYDDFVASSQEAENDDLMCMGSSSWDQDAENDEEVYTKRAMALAHPAHAFTPKQYESTWLIPTATAAAYAEAYGLPVDKPEDFRRTGVWAPGLPVLRALPGFVGVSSAQTDAPDCQHKMGKQQSHTGGTFGGFCSCSHPKCLGVVVLDQSESQRMPLEFVVQRFATLPDTIV